jgi:hypothetical protein
MTDALVMIHVRFAPNGEVTEIGERPEDTSAQVWFNRLSRHRGNGYQPLSGGRALFRISRENPTSTQRGVTLWKTRCSTRFMRRSKVAAQFRT